MSASIDDFRNTQDAASSPPKKRKRTAISRACERCRHRKIRCDGKQPCNICADKDVACSYGDVLDQRRSAETQYLYNRLTEFENLLKQHGISPKTTGEPPSSSYTSISVAPSQGCLDSAVCCPPNSSLGFVIPHPTLPATGFEAGSDSMQYPTTQVYDNGTRSEAETPPKKRIPPFTSIPAQQDGFERLKRTGESGGVILFGETSLFSHLPDDTHEQSNTPSPSPVVNSGQPRLEWSQNLPPGFHIDKRTHDIALDFFGSYWGSWCMVVDFPAFQRDLVTCNTIGPDIRTPRKTNHYSPLLHCVVLFLGIHFGRQAWPTLASQYYEVYTTYCTKLMMSELRSPTLSTLRAVNLLSTSLSEPPAGRGSIGYSIFGSAVALIQIIGLNVPCGSYVEQNRMTSMEKRLRDNTFWAVYMYDVLRGIAAGRPPLIGPPQIDLPEIDDDQDDVPWTMPSEPLSDSSAMGSTLNGQKSMRSTVFHWSVKLARLHSDVRIALYPIANHDPQRKDRVQELTTRLDQWQSSLPPFIANPAATPLPHIIVLHLFFHLTSIYLFRPFYRTIGDDGSRIEAGRCNAAANSVLQLLKLYDLFHSVQRAPGTLINIIFSTTTVFLMKGAEEQDQSAGLSRAVRRSLGDLCNLMREMSSTYWDAGRGLTAVCSLCSDWLPGALDADILASQQSITNQTPTSTVGHTSLPSTTTLVDQPIQATDASASMWLFDTLPGMDDWLIDGDPFAGLAGSEEMVSLTM